jgi:hypothetical protein
MPSEPKGIRCARCGSRTRHADDRYHLLIPEGWTLEDVHAWGEDGLTLAYLRLRGVRVLRFCAGCGEREETQAA